MQIAAAALNGLILIEPRIFRDARGCFMETFRQDWFSEHVCAVDFVQENQSISAEGVLRGLHYQLPYAQGKLVRAVSGSVFDVAVDLRCGSPTFGRWAAAVLSAQNGRQLWIPQGFAHGFYVLSAEAAVAYKCTDDYRPEAEHTLRWDDPCVGVRWPVRGAPVLSARDAAGRDWADVPKFQAA